MIAMKFFIFDRPRTIHRWQSIFSNSSPPQASKTFDSLSRNLVLNNWKMDHRVTDLREQKLLSSQSFKKNPRDTDNWQKQREDYFKLELCRHSDPPTKLNQPSAFCRDENQFNKLALHQFSQREQLFHIKSFNSTISRVFSGNSTSPEYNHRNINEIFDLGAIAGQLGDRIKNSGFNQQFLNELAEGLNDHGPGKIRELAGYLVEALGDMQPPWWAVFAEEVMELYKDKDWTGLCRTLGMGHIKAGEWILIFRYQARQVRSHHRPTVVEDGGNPFHFPSPPKYPFGITMPLEEISKRAVREIIHAPMNRDIAESTATGQLVQVKDAPFDHEKNDLSAVRLSHCKRLRREFPGLQYDRSWMDRHRGII